MRTLRKLRMKVSQIIRLDSPKIKQELNKKINKEIEPFIPMKLTCHHHLLFNRDPMVEPVKRTKMKIHRSSRRQDHKKSKVKKEPLSMLTKSKHRLQDKIQAVRDIKTLWHLKMKIYKLELKWANPSQTLKLTSQIVTCFCLPQKMRRTRKG